MPPQGPEDGQKPLRTTFSKSPRRDKRQGIAEGNFLVDMNSKQSPNRQDPSKVSSLPKRSGLVAAPSANLVSKEQHKHGKDYFRVAGKAKSGLLISSASSHSPNVKKTQLTVDKMFAGSQLPPKRPTYISALREPEGYTEKPRERRAPVHRVNDVEILQRHQNLPKRKKIVVPYPAPQYPAPSANQFSNIPLYIPAAHPTRSRSPSPAVPESTKDDDPVQIADKPWHTDLPPKQATETMPLSRLPRLLKAGEFPTFDEKTLYAATIQIVSAGHVKLQKALHETGLAFLRLFDHFDYSYYLSLDHSSEEDVMKSKLRQCIESNISVTRAFGSSLLAAFGPLVLSRLRQVQLSANARQLVPDFVHTILTEFGLEDEMREELALFNKFFSGGHHGNHSVLTPDEDQATLNVILVHNDGSRSALLWLDQVVFCAVSSGSQVKGYGRLMMNHLKEWAKRNNIHNILTYADNFAIPFFKKQGFDKELRLPDSRWQEFIKHYDGAVLMECRIHPHVNYTSSHDLLQNSRKRFMTQVDQMGQFTSVQKGLDFSTVSEYRIEDVPGVADSNWKAEDTSWEKTDHLTFQRSLRAIIREAFDHYTSNDFRYDVAEDVKNYYQTIKNPICLFRIEDKIICDAYPTREEFLSDVRLLFDNARLYHTMNPQNESAYFLKAAVKLSQHIEGRVRFRLSKRHCYEGFMFQPATLQIVSPVSHKENLGEFNIRKRQAMIYMKTVEERIAEAKARVVVPPPSSSAPPPSIPNLPMPSPPAPPHSTPIPSQLPAIPLVTSVSVAAMGSQRPPMSTARVVQSTSSRVPSVHSPVASNGVRQDLAVPVGWTKPTRPISDSLISKK